MNGGACRDYGSGLNCSCSDAYTGIGCQYEYDACAQGMIFHRLVLKSYLVFFTHIILNST